MYEWVEHTAELELRIEAATPREVFALALEAFAEVVGDGDEGEPAGHALWLVAGDRASLLARWLDELVFLADAESFVPERADPLDVGAKELRAQVHGRVASPRPLVKAVTYHGLEFVRRGGIWQAKVVLDV